jgi:hypothetical protein
MPPVDDAPCELVPADTALSDRALIIHLLQHVEDMHAELAAFRALLAEFGPLLEKYRNRGGLAKLVF